MSAATAQVAELQRDKDELSAEIAGLKSACRTRGDEVLELSRTVDKVSKERDQVCCSVRGSDG